MENFNYVVANAAPIRWANIKDDAMSSVEFVAPEVLVSSVLQRMFGKKSDPMFGTALAHLLSIPFIGGVQPYGDAHAKMGAPYMNQVMNGLSGVPGFFLGHYLAGIFQGEDIIRWTKWGMKDIMIAIIGKIITRPVFTSVDPLIGKDNAIRTSYNALQGRFDLQSKHSNLKMDG